ncbi:MAG TPA: type II toxin-antitoxin system VapC family toxin [Aldersonia sp.]
MVLTYLDSSAIVKLAVQESESDALRRYLRRRRLVSSALARTEVMRAMLPIGQDAIVRGRRVLGGLDLVRVSNRTLTAAGTLLPVELRSLDAIHLATAEQLGDDVGVIVTYDARMATAAELLDYHVAAPH